MIIFVLLEGVSKAVVESAGNDCQKEHFPFMGSALS